MEKKLDFVVTERKAVSALVATILLVLITVAAVGLIWGLIMPVLQENISDVSKSCTNSKMVINTKEGYTCLDSENKQVRVMVSRGADSSELYGVYIILSSGGTSKKFEVTEDLPGSNEDKTYKINITGTSLENSTIEKVAIAPMFRIGDSKQVCGVVSKVDIQGCI